VQVKLTPLHTAEDRLHPRRRVRLRARFDDPGVDAFDALVVELSERGCRIKGADWLQEGDRFLIKLPALEARAGRVAWVGDREIGCEFDTPLYRGECATAQAPTAQPRREKTSQFGRRLRALAGLGGGSDDER
jgi:hypothetical protein